LISNLSLAQQDAQLTQYMYQTQMFNPAYEYIKSKDNVNLTDPNGIPLVFSTEEENIVVDFNTEDFPGLN
jgi:hypothetical protein